MRGNGTAKLLIAYLVCMFIGQLIAVGIGLLIDPYSKNVALATFIPLYYAMYWVAWRAALMIADRSPEVTTETVGGPKVGVWLLAPAVLALDIA
jgi:energy-converting hydrogenase Eha subunit E